MDSLRDRAKQLRSQGSHQEAVLIYQEIYVPNDKWLAWEYADSLKKSGDIDGCIDIAKQNYEKYPDFKYNSDLLAWSLYEKYIKNINKEPVIESKEKILEIGEFITSICTHNDKVPYELTVFNIIEFLKKKDTKASIILYWLEKLEREKISKNTYQFTDHKGQTREGASRLEKYFAVKTKALLSEGLYKECVDTCDLALAEINEFHYDNDVWIKRNKYYSLGLLGNETYAIDKIIELTNFKDYWFLYAIISRLYLSLSDLKNALLFALRAAYTNDPPTMKVNFYCELAGILEKYGKEDIALKHYLFSKKVRDENNWRLPNSIRDKIAHLARKHSPQDVTLIELKEYWLNELYRLLPSHVGTISKILPNRKAGFIKTDNLSFYFKTSSINNGRGKIVEGLQVSFLVIDSYDPKKKQKTKEAAYIRML